MKKLSVITVTFNAVTTLERTLRSVSEQSWPHLEHLVIDGGSDDGTLELIN
ncbi:glycosyltransferase, partial [Mesotoga sp.]|uniref:glycosyltransferase n=1 Tax=Mesotoga sp. TaxID=2053577 RepID=UPI003567B6B3